MFIKINKGNTLFDKLIEVCDKMHECDRAALDFAISLGGDQIRNGWWNMGGGITSIRFTGKVPKGWIKAGAKYEANEYLVSSAPSGRDWRKKIENLPKVTFDDFNNIFGYDASKHIGNRRSSHPGIAWYVDYILMEFADHTPYTPVEFMEEITITEYKKLIENGKKRK